MRILSKILLSALLLTISGCGNYYGKTDNYVTPIGGSMVTQNSTIYSKGLSCLADQLIKSNITPGTMSVGRMLDYTGKDDLETGKRLTQGAALMMMSAIGKVGIPQVERFDTTVSEFELKMKDNKLIKNSIPGDTRNYQPIMAGSLQGSKYTVIGGITELNYNIRSNDVSAFFDVASGGLRFYVMNVAMDIRLVETESLKIVATRSYQKQIIGREIRAGVFKFFDDKLLDIGVGERSLEPMQLAVRSIAELAIYDLIKDLYRIPPGPCDAIIRSVERAK